MAKGASMKELELTLFLEENETPNTRAYTHALDLAYLFVDEMERQGLSKKELAEKMGIGQSRLSNLLNTQPNMTLETIAQFELALGVDLTFTLEKDNGALTLPAVNPRSFLTKEENSVEPVHKDPEGI